MGKSLEGSSHRQSNQSQPITFNKNSQKSSQKNSNLAKSEIKRKSELEEVKAA